jgi:hypothetical protein
VNVTPPNSVIYWSLAAVGAAGAQPAGKGETAGEHGDETPQGVVGATRLGVDDHRRRRGRGVVVMVMVVVGLVLVMVVVVLRRIGLGRGLIGLGRGLEALGHAVLRRGRVVLRLLPILRRVLRRRRFLIQSLVARHVAWLLLSYKMHKCKKVATSKSNADCQIITKKAGW